MLLPPHVNLTDKVVLFDGECRLCSAWSQFLLRFDKKGGIKLAAVQSQEGEDILKFFKMPTHTYDTFVYIEEGRAFIRSEAFFKVVQTLPFPWPILCAGKALPQKIADWLYDRIAQNRYRIFGKNNLCTLPTAEQEARFLHGK